jgi:hypothetical protein
MKINPFDSQVSKPGVCSGRILSGVFNPGLKIGVWRRQTFQKEEEMLIKKYLMGKSILAIAIIFSFFFIGAPVSAWSDHH